MPSDFGNLRPMKMGKRLDIEMRARGMSQAGLCALVNSDRDEKDHLEDGTISAIIKRPSANSKFAPAIAKALGVELHWLLTGEEPKTNPQASAPVLNLSRAALPDKRRNSPEIAKVINLLNEMSDVGVGRVLGFAEGVVGQYRKGVKSKLAK